jgi:cysteine desulfurase
MNKTEVYLDYNATTPVAPEVLNEMLPYLHTHFGNPSGGYAIGRHNKEALEKAREQVASLIGAMPEEIVFTSGGTESNNHAIQGAAFSGAGKGKHIITSQVEHPSVANVCKFLEVHGYKVTRLPVDRTGRIDPEEVEKAIRPDTVLITIMHANNEVGTVQPVKEIGLIAKKNNILFHTDAAQSAGKLAINVDESGVDLLSVAGHKIYAPKGIGALYIREGVRLKNLLFGAGQERGLRPGTENVPYIVALGKACELARENRESDSRHLHTMRQRLLEGLKRKSNVAITVNSDLQNCLPNTLSISFKSIEAYSLTSLLDGKVNISTGSACHSRSVEISPVLRAMNIEESVAAGTVRISTGRYTTEEEIDYAVDTITEAVNKL